MRRSHHMLKRWPVKRRWLVVLEATMYTRILWAAAIGGVLVCSREPTNAEIFHYKNYIFA